MLPNFFEWLWKRRYRALFFITVFMLVIVTAHPIYEYLMTNGYTTFAEKYLSSIQCGIIIGTLIFLIISENDDNDPPKKKAKSSLKKVANTPVLSRL